jgi:hypothetical protein
MGTTLGKLIWDPIVYIPNLFKFGGTLANYFFRSVILGVPVSFPGGPRPKALDRFARWNNPENLNIPGIHFATDKRSHEITNKEHPKYPLTGESAGRQIWYLDEKSAATEAPNYTFCAAKNPNANDKLLQRDLLGAWYVPESVFVSFQIY